MQTPTRHPVSCGFVGKVHTACASIDVAKPYEITPLEDEVAGTVFFVEGRSLGLNEHAVVALTNAHCVENAYRSTCRVIQNNVILGTFAIRWICFDLDFAVLVPEEVVTVDTCSIALQPTVPGTRIAMYGYPLDCDVCQCAYGVVSAPGSNFWMQCSLSSNFGNSGGPLIGVDEHAVHGIVTQSPALSEAITEAVPMWAVHAALDRWRPRDGSVIVRVPTLQIETTALNEVMAAHLCCAEEPQHGLVVHTSAVPGVKRMDVLRGAQDNEGHNWPVTTHSNEILTAHAGEVQIDSEALALELPLSFHMMVQRPGVKGTLMVPVTQQTPALAHVREYYPCWEQVPYVRRKGVVLTALSKNLLDLYDNYCDSEYLRTAWLAYDSRHKCTGRVAVSFVHPQSHASDCGLKPLMLIKTINGKPIRATEDAEHELRAGTGTRQKICIIEIDDNTKYAVDANKL